MFEFFLFAIVTSITPGPNNSMLMASGIKFGRKASVPHFLGIWIGFSFLFLVGGFILSFVPEVIFKYLQYFGYVVITYIAYKISTTKTTSSDNNKVEKPLTFIQGCLFQWVNPKGLVMAISGLTTFNITSFEGAAIYFSVLPFCVGVWLVLGEGLQKWLINNSSSGIYYKKKLVISWERTIYILLGLSMLASLLLA
mgnify:FL=1